MSGNLVTRESEIKTGLVSQQKIINSLLGDKEKSDKFMATALKVSSDPKLLKCTSESIINACVTVAQVGLDLSPVLQHAYLVPYKTSVQLIVSAKGYTALMARTGWEIKSYVVSDKDEFKYEIDGFDDIVSYKRNLDESGNFKYAVAIAKSPSGSLFVEVMNKSDIEKRRLASSNQTSINEYTSAENKKKIEAGLPVGVWDEWYEAMALKSVIKSLAKKLPIGEDIASVIDVDDKVIETVEATPSKSVDINSMLNKPKAQDAEIVV